ncbi:MAG: prepilin-type N-terminal cleavage/methylation domain-containing protein [Vibrionaceae bacterium]
MICNKLKSNGSYYAAARGFSLLESMLALVLLVVCCYGSFVFYRYLEIERANNFMWQKALFVAQEQIAVLKAVNSDTGCNGEKAEFSSIETCLLPEIADFPYTTTMSVIKNVPDPVTGEALVKFIDVSVAWTDRRKQPQQLTLQFAVSKQMNLFK